jgi:hypothetical protein
MSETDAAAPRHLAWGTRTLLTLAATVVVALSHAILAALATMLVVASAQFMWNPTRVGGICVGSAGESEAT